MKPAFVSDCEGPVVKNDIAYDLAAHFIPEGDKLYEIIRNYDYMHANFPKRRDYRVGSASKLVLPFLLAFNADNKTVEEFSAANLVLMKGSGVTLNYVQQVSEAFMISTSYEHYVRVLCRETGFPLENTYSTEVNLDGFELSAKDKSKLRSLAWEIGGMPPIEIPPNAKGLRDLSSRDQATISRLDKIFWKEVVGTHCKKLYSDVVIAGSEEKLSAVEEVAGNLAVSLENVMYVGDDVTDAAAMKFVRNSGGLAVSINGDEAAVRNAELAVLSDSNVPVAVLADVFLRLGRVELARVASSFDQESLWRSLADPTLLDRLFEIPRKSWPKVYFVTDYTVESVVASSEQFRNTVEGELTRKSA